MSGVGSEPMVNSRRGCIINSGMAKRMRRAGSPMLAALKLMRPLSFDVLMLDLLMTISRTRVLTVIFTLAFAVVANILTGDYMDRAKANFWDYVICILFLLGGSLVVYVDGVFRSLSWRLGEPDDEGERSRFREHLDLYRKKLLYAVALLAAGSFLLLISPTHLVPMSTAGPDQETERPLDTQNRGRDGGGS